MLKISRKAKHCLVVVFFELLAALLTRIVVTLSH